MKSYDAVVVGAGPNGLSAAVTLAREGLSVLVCEAHDTVGGGARTAELTRPGFRHDVCSSVYPFAAGSPFFAELPLADHGLEWVHPPIAVAHPMDDGTAAVVERSLDATVARLGRDGRAYRWLVGPVASGWWDVADDLLRPLRLPTHPLATARMTLRGVWPARALARALFREERTRALFAGMAGHSMLPLDHPLTAAFGVLLAAAAHSVGWPFARGGAQSIADALASYLLSLGGEIRTSFRVSSMDDLPPADTVLFDLTPSPLLAVAGDRLPARYRRRLERFRYGPGVFKIDFALDGPIPWTAPECTQAGTVHLGATLDEVAQAESEVRKGRVPDRPFVILTQPSLFDPGRAPTGQHTAWAYCRVPPGSSVNMTPAIEGQIARFAPGFAERVIARSVRGPSQIEEDNPNYVGGDIGGGAHDLLQLLARPMLRLDPYSTPNEKLYICSSATPPGGGVHGLCGYWAARSALAGRLSTTRGPS